MKRKVLDLFLSFKGVKLIFKIYKNLRYYIFVKTFLPIDRLNLRSCGNH